MLRYVDVTPRTIIEVFSILGEDKSDKISMLLSNLRSFEYERADSFTTSPSVWTFVLSTKLLNCSGLVTFIGEERLRANNKIIIPNNVMARERTFNVWGMIFED